MRMLNMSPGPASVKYLHQSTYINILFYRFSTLKYNSLRHKNNGKVVYGQEIKEKSNGKQY